jgi:hypothetical protein
MDQEQKRGDAKMLLEHPLLVEAFQRIENDAIEAAINVSEPIDDVERFKRALKVNVIRDVRTELQMIVLEKPRRTSRDR